VRLPQQVQRQRAWLWLAFALTIAVTIVLLRVQGRLWICECGQVRLWVSEAQGANTSQHLFDPYSFTHVLHGFLFFWLIAWLLPRLRGGWQLWLAIAVEAAWEVVENSEFIIRRYREATAARGYFGDTIVNSLGDILACGLGFLLARYLGVRRSVLVFLIVEVLLVIWIRDSLLLNILMLLFPIEAIKRWQAGQ
jgi:hypothetical protein